MKTENSLSIELQSRSDGEDTRFYWKKLEQSWPSAKGISTGHGTYHQPYPSGISCQSERKRKSPFMTKYNEGVRQLLLISEKNHKRRVTEDGIPSRYDVRLYRLYF
ncbi:hypothetical protein J6590_031021, partial [Homalodisca vitripennis]